MFGTHGNLPSITNLVGYWPFNETSGTNAPDLSGNGNDGTLVNMEDADWVDGVVGKCLGFNGINEYVNFGDVLDVTTDFTIVFWFKAGATGAAQGLITKGEHANSSAWGCELAASGQLVFGGRNYSSGSLGITRAAITSETFSSGVFYNVAFTYNGGSENKGNIYVNGVKQALSQELVYTLRGNSYPLRIAIYSDGSKPFNGLIDEVRIYDTALTASEIKALYLYPGGK